MTQTQTKKAPRGRPRTSRGNGSPSVSFNLSEKENATILAACDSAAAGGDKPKSRGQYSREAAMARIALERAEADGMQRWQEDYDAMDGDWVWLDYFVKGLRSPSERIQAAGGLPEGLTALERERYLELFDRGWRNGATLQPRE